MPAVTQIAHKLQGRPSPRKGAPNRMFCAMNGTDDQHNGSAPIRRYVRFLLIARRAVVGDLRPRALAAARRPESGCSGPRCRPPAARRRGGQGRFSQGSARPDRPASEATAIGNHCPRLVTRTHSCRSRDRNGPSEFRGTPQIDLGTRAYGAIWGYGVGPPSDTETGEISPKQTSLEHVRVWFPGCPPHTLRSRRPCREAAVSASLIAPVIPPPTRAAHRAVMMAGYGRSAARCPGLRFVRGPGRADRRTGTAPGRASRSHPGRTAPEPKPGRMRGRKPGGQPGSKGSHLEWRASPDDTVPYYRPGRARAARTWPVPPTRASRPRTR